MQHFPILLNLQSIHYMTHYSVTEINAFKFYGGTSSMNSF